MNASEITPPSTAILVVDMQNDTVSASGAYAATGAAAHAEKQHVIAHVRQILDSGRAQGLPIFHSRIIVYPRVGLGGANAPIFRMLAPDTFKQGSWGAAIVDELTPQGDEVVLDRTRMSVFNGTEIDIRLRNLAVTSLIVVGAWTNMAVEHTVRDAADHGYQVTVVTDATSSLSDEWQDAGLNFALTNIATLADTQSVIASLTE
jgi:nicotinamidase-related amidase